MLKKLSLVKPSCHTCEKPKVFGATYQIHQSPTLGSTSWVAYLCCWLLLCTSRSSLIRQGSFPLLYKLHDLL